MRIGIDATICLTEKPTGLGIYTINIVNALNRMHDDIIVWTVEDRGMDLDRSKVRKVMQGMRFLGNRHYQARPCWIELFLPRLAKEEKIDVLFSTVPSALTRSPVPHVVTILDLIPLTLPGEVPWTVAWNYRHRIPRVLQNAAAVVTISEYTKGEAFRLYHFPRERIFPVLLGYDRENFRPHADSRVLERFGLQPQAYVLYVGNASPRKNLAMLIRAFAAVAPKVPHKLVLCGAKTRSERKDIDRLLAQERVKDRVLLLDYVPYGDLPALYSGAAVFVYPSLAEGFGLPVLEAMACGTPVIASDTTSLPEVAGDAAVLVDPTKIGSISHSMIDLLSDQDARRERSRAGLERSRTFTWERAGEQVLNILLKSAVRERTQ